MNFRVAIAVDCQLNIVLEMVCMYQYLLHSVNIKFNIQSLCNHGYFYFYLYLSGEEVKQVFKLKVEFWNKTVRWLKSNQRLQNNRETNVALTILLCCVYFTDFSSFLPWIFKWLISLQDLFKGFYFSTKKT